MRVKVPALKRLASVAPLAPIPIKRIADFEALSESPEILDYARRELDRIWSWSLTARSAASLFTYDPPVDWSRVEIPTLVLVGGADEMVSASFTERVLAASRPPNAELRILPGLGHLLLHDHLDEVLPIVSTWLRSKLPEPATVAARAT
jgi:pimeloyl-ACP methyl ester carboxylesterase